MLSHEDNQLLTQVGPQKPMGDLLRKYWIPACLSEEVAEKDGTPKRVKLLGESLLAFRDSNGQVGLIGELCPHRSASLVFGRNEECGIRCLYHGWKIDSNGNLVDVPTEPEGSKVQEKVKQKAYPTIEKGDIVWTYMGPPDLMPPFPDFEFMHVPPKNRAIAKMISNVNWAQAIEGSLDSSHSGILHSSYRGGLRPTNDLAPIIETEDTPYGFRYAAIRKPLEDPEHLKYVRVTLFVAPFHCLIPPKGARQTHHMFVPLDDEHTALYWVDYSTSVELDTQQTREKLFAVVGVDLDENYNKKRTLDNLFLQDREAMRTGKSYTGIDGVPNQDMAMQESMGAIVDRSQENLGMSDIAIIKFRRTLLKAVRSHMEGGTPIGLDVSVPFRELRSDGKIIPIEESWKVVTPL